MGVEVAQAVVHFLDARFRKEIGNLGLMFYISVTHTQIQLSFTVLYFYFRIGNWEEYPCKCPEDCKRQENINCAITKTTRAVCKYCRFVRCQTLAGMVKKWVVGQGVPKAEKCKRIRKTKSVGSDL